MPTHNSLLYCLLPLSHFGVGLRRQPGNSESTADVSVGSVPFEIYGPCGAEAMRLLSAVFIMALLLRNGFYLLRAKIRGRMFILLPASLWSQRLLRRLMNGIYWDQSHLSM